MCVCEGGAGGALVFNGLPSKIRHFRFQSFIQCQCLVGFNVISVEERDPEFSPKISPLAPFNIRSLLSFLFVCFLVFFVVVLFLFVWLLLLLFFFAVENILF